MVVEAGAGGGGPMSPGWAGLGWIIVCIAGLVREARTGWPATEWAAVLGAGRWALGRPWPWPPSRPRGASRTFRSFQGGREGAEDEDGWWKSGHDAARTNMDTEWLGVASDGLAGHGSPSEH